MLQKIQRFGGAMFTPVLLFAFAGTTIGIGTLFTTEAIMGGLADPNGLWYQVWNVILQGGWTVFNQLPLNLRGWITNRSCEKTTSKMLYGSVSTLSNISIFLKYDLKPMGRNFRS